MSTDTLKPIKTKNRAPVARSRRHPEVLGWKIKPHAWYPQIPLFKKRSGFL